MRRLKQWFRRLDDLPFRRKLLAGFLLAGLIPLMIVGTFAYTGTTRLLRQQTESTLNSALRTADNAVAEQIRVYENLGIYIAHSKEVFSIAAEEFESKVEEFSALHYSFDVFLREIYTQHPEIMSITLYVDRENRFHGKELRPLTDLEAERWYEPGMKFYSTGWQIDSDGNVCVIQQVPEPYLYYIQAYSPHLLCIRIAPREFFSALDSIYTDYRIRVAQGDEVFYEAAEPVSLNAEGTVEKWISRQGETLRNGWRITLETPVNVYEAPVRRVMMTIMVMMAAVLGLVVLFANRMAASLSGRVSRLNNAMQQVRGGNLDIQIKGEGGDEIGQLTDHFQDTVNDLKRLVVQNLENQVKLRETQLEALQAQINPHFLYNALSMINSRALMDDEPEISEMAQLLSTFYRTTLNKGRQQTTLDQEISNVRSYVRIQQLLCDNAFDASFQVDESLNALEMPNLLLQPLVENAIIHGMLPNRERRGRLLVSVTRSGDKAVFSVMDNGVGIEPEKAAVLTQRASKGYGLKNVNERLKLAYGEGCSLTINSQPGQSTMVTFIIPIGSEIKE